MLIEKQAAAAAHLNSPSRLEAFAADSPPHRRRPRTSPPTGGGKGSGSGGGDGGGRGRRDGDAASPQLHRAGSSGGIALSELVSATTPPRRCHATKTGRGGSGAIVGDGVGAERRSLAQETYTKTFSGMQVWYYDVRVASLVVRFESKFLGARETGKSRFWSRCEAHG